MTEDEQFNALRSWLMTATGLPEIIKAHQDGPRVAGPYGVLNLLNSIRLHFDVRMTYIDNPAYDAGNPGAAEPFIARSEIPTEWVWSFNVYASGAFGYAEAAKNAAGTGLTQKSLGPLLSVNRTSLVRRIPAPVDQRWEDRAQIDLHLQGYSIFDTPVDVGEQITVTTTPDAGGVPAQTTINKP